MNVTSMLSSGYLQPSVRPVREDADAARMQSASLALQEQQVLSQERALKTASGDVSTTYRYTVGPDGRRYITGAEVVIRGEAQELDRIAGGIKRRELKPRTTEAPNENTDTEASASEPADGSANSDAVRELKQIEQEVIAHEAAHKAAGGRFAGAVSYTYTQGPDGKRYITGGEVPIHVPASDDPEQTLRDMQQVQRAALAPGTPSGQDLGVAAQAAMAAAQARQEIAAGKGSKSEDALKTGIASIQADIRHDRLLSEPPEDAGSHPAETVDPREAYARTTSKRGLWTPERGFEPEISRDRPDNGLDIAA